MGGARTPPSDLGDIFPSPCEGEATFTQAECTGRFQFYATVLAVQLASTIDICYTLYFMPSPIKKKVGSKRNSPLTELYSTLKTVAILLNPILCHASILGTSSSLLPQLLGSDNSPPKADQSRKEGVDEQDQTNERKRRDVKVSQWLHDDGHRKSVSMVCLLFSDVYRNVTEHQTQADKTQLNSTGHVQTQNLTPLICSRLRQFKAVVTQLIRNPVNHRYEPCPCISTARDYN